MKRDFQIFILVSVGLSGASALSAQGAGTGVVSDFVNRGLPGWLRFSGEDRVRLEDLDGIGFKSAGNEYLLQRLRLNMLVAPLPWLKFNFQAQDSRVAFSNVHPSPSSQLDPMDLRLGYVEVGNSEEGHMSMRVGRQALAFGEGRLLADPAWSNVGRSFDAVRLTLRFHGIRLDAFTSASDKIITDGCDTPVLGEHFHGLYGSMSKLIPGATVEPYLFWKLEHNIKAELGGSGNLDEKTAGVRLVGKLPLSLDYGVEMALERGDIKGEPIDAWAAHWVAGYTVAKARKGPRVFAELNRASGDANAKDGVHGAFDPLFASSHDKFGVADQFTWTNLWHFRPGVEYRLRPTLKLAAAYNSFWLVNIKDGIYNSGKVTIASNGTQGRHVGQEPDIQAQWSVTRQTVVDAAYGYIFPGEFLRKTSHDFSYHCIFLGITQRF